jgi:hypothetical protein
VGACGSCGYHVQCRRYRRLRAPATSFIWTKMSPVSGDLLLSLAALNIPRQVSLQRDLQASAIALEHDASTSARMASAAPVRLSSLSSARQRLPTFLAIDVGHARVQQLRHPRASRRDCSSAFLASSDRSSSLIDNAKTPSLMAWMNFRISRWTAASSWRPCDRLAAMLHPQPIQLANVLATSASTCSGRSRRSMLLRTPVNSPPSRWRSNGLLM